MRDEPQAAGRRLDFEVHVVRSLDQPDAVGEAAADRAEGHEVEDLAFGRVEARRQRDLQGAVQRGQPGHPHLVVAGACDSPFDLDQQLAASALREGRAIQETRRITRADEAMVDQVDMQCAAATQGFIGGYGEHAIDEGAAARDLRGIKSGRVDGEGLRQRRRHRGTRVGAGLGAGFISSHQGLRHRRMRDGARMITRLVGAEQGQVVVSGRHEQRVRGTEHRVGRQQHPRLERLQTERISGSACNPPECGHVLPFF